MYYRLGSYKTNFFMALSLLATECFLHSAENNRLPLIRSRSESPIEDFPYPSLSPCRDDSGEKSPEPTQPDDTVSCYSVIGNKSFIKGENGTVAEFYEQLLINQSVEILSDFCQEARISLEDLSGEVRNLQDQFPDRQLNSGESECWIKNFFSKRGYGHKSITFRQGDRWGNSPACTSCKGVAILPAFYNLSKLQQQIELHRVLQHFIHNDNFYMHIMKRIVVDRKSTKLQAILEQYKQFFQHRAEIEIGIYAGDQFRNQLQESHYALQAPVNYMEELSHMIEQEQKAPMIKAWMERCELSNHVSKNMVRTESFSDLDDDNWTDAQEYNNRLQCTGVDF